MDNLKLSKEEIKAIKQGFAYKSWNRKRGFVILASLIWCFGGIALIHINNVTSAIYSIGLVVCLIALFHSVIIVCWKCPACKEKLPSKDVCGGTATVCMPILVKNCPYCRADLTQQFKVKK
ncbi:MAG: hypothetical protein IKK33_09295 [Lachnospiraceae bacterium]|nr:hypothetical protein [Lachnospiraceae bacterium]